jgi:hypothetical protein
MQTLKLLLNRLDINLKKTGKKNDVDYKTPVLEDLHNEKMFWKIYSSSAESGIYIYTQIHIYIYLYIYIYMYMYIFIYICIYMCVNMFMDINI